MTGKPTAPRGLDTEGRKLWRAVAGSWTLRPDELRLLEAACRTLDEIEVMQVALADGPSLVMGSRGNMRPNPLLDSVRHHRALLASLVRQLALPDLPLHIEGVEASSQLSAKRSAAAHARWDKHRREVEELP